MKKPNPYLIALLLLIVFAALAISSIWPDRKSPTADELAHHIPVGYVLLSKWDFKMDTSHPPLSRYIVALPLKMFMKLNMPDDKSEWRREDRADFGKDFFYKYNNQPHKMIFLSRLAVVVVGILCGIILFLWSKALYGKKVALFGLFLYSLSPNILAHTRLATTDMTSTCFTLLAISTFWLFVTQRILKNMVFSGICLGLAQLSKYSSLLLYPVFLLLMAFELPKLQIEKRKGFIIKIFLIFAISLFVLWAGYGFSTAPILKDAMRVEEKLGIAQVIAAKILPFWKEGLSDYLERFLLNAPFPLGEHLLGILGVIRHGYEGHRTFFLGKWSSHGNPLYFIVAFLIKTPIPTIIFLFTSLLFSLRERIGRNERFILITVALFFVTASFSKLQLGLRYILPIYPFIFILAAGNRRFLANRILRIPVILLMAWYAFSSLWIWPDYLSYFNEAIGGPRNGHRYLSDSNIDWGQDLPALASYMDKSNIDIVKLAYFGTAKPEYYGINYKALNHSELRKPKPGNVYAISIMSADSVATWTNKHEPDSKAGRSILIYDFRNKSIK